MTDLFHPVTGRDFARSIRWARKQPPNPITEALRQHSMSYINHQIQAAINAAESVAKPLSPASTPVTITQETLVALIQAAKDYLEFAD